MFVSTEKYLNVAVVFRLFINSLELDCLTKNPLLGKPLAASTNDAVYQCFYIIGYVYF